MEDSGVRCAYYPYNSETGDIDGDGIDEIAFVNRCDDDVTIYSVNGSALDPFYSYDLNDVQSVSFADLYSSDDNLEVVLTSRDDSTAVVILTLNSSADGIEFEDQVIDLDDGVRNNAETVDLDGDGDLDIQ